MLRAGSWVCAVFVCCLIAVSPSTAQRAPLLSPLSDGAEVVVGEVNPAVPLPAEVLGYPLGQRFTQYHRVREYLRAVANACDRMVEIPYGETYEGRPLALFVISSPENLAKLEEIRQGQLRMALGEAPAADAPVVVWLAYGVHGNESSSTEAAMAAVYRLTAGRGEVDRWLGKAVVIVDPLVNPDGRERYVSGFLQRRGRVADPSADAWEHAEPWPGGRYNHYGIDLNRDWAWASQRETQDRLRMYRRWEPHVYVDYHEMNSDSSYFFPPSAEPILPQIDRRTVAWLETFGRGNAAAMDAQGWVYYKGERFDLFYPGYGDSYPSLRGAVGMTYEMAGHGFAGQILDLPDGRRLTLADRIARHFTTSMATVRTAVENRERLLADFAAVRRGPQGAPRTYAWQSAGESASAAWALADLLQLHGLDVRQLTGPADVPARRIGDGRADSHAFPAGTLVATTEQPLGALLEALLEREAPMQASFLERQRRRVDQNLDPEFYDVTAWSLPLAFQVEVWRTEGGLEGFGETTGPRVPAGGLVEGGGPGEPEIGFLIPPQGLAGYRLASRLQERGLLHRLAVEPFSLGGESYPAGTLFVPTRGNPEDLKQWLGDTLEELGLVGRRATSAYSASGVSLGSDLLVPVRAPRIGLLSGDGLQPTGHGALWFLLDQLAQVPFSRLGMDFPARGDLATYDVLVLPPGRYSGVSKVGKERLESWLKGGGVVVAVAGAVDWLRRQEWIRLEAAVESGNGTGDGGEGEEPSDPLGGLRLNIPGAAVATEMSAGHPLTVGLADAPPVLFQGRRYLKATGDPLRDVLVARQESPLLAGFAWPEAQEKLPASVLVASEGVGRGRVVAFAHDPAFRLFWRGTMPLLLNAVLYGPSLNAARLLQ